MAAAAKSSRPTATRAHRTGVRITRDVGIALREVAAQRGHDLPALLLSWALIGAYAAKTGAPMPPGRVFPRRPDDDHLRWVQSAEEAAEWAAAVRGAGSSMRSVIEGAAFTYIDVNGDLLKMFDLWQERYAGVDVTSRGDVSLEHDAHQ